MPITLISHTILVCDQQDSNQNKTRINESSNLGPSLELPKQHCFTPARRDKHTAPFVFPTLPWISTGNVIDYERTILVTGMFRNTAAIIIETKRGTAFYSPRKRTSKTQSKTKTGNSRRI